MSEMHTDHKLWLEKLAFYSDELITFKKRLEEVAVKNTKKEIMAQLEHFQNQFIRQAEVLDILKHDIRLLEESLKDKVLTNPIATDRRRVLDEPAMREEVETFEHIFWDLKDEFKRFLTQTL